MDSLFRTEDVPSSPWATRFPIANCTFTWENKNHSVLAPRHPTVADPKYYNQNPVFSRADLPQTPQDEDRIFSTEYMQKARLLGLQTWKAAALNHYACFSPNTIVSSGHQQVDRTAAPLASYVSVSLSAPAPVGDEEPRVQTVEEVNFAAYIRDRIEVNENGWLPFLRKHRWFDWNQAHSTGIKIWSVDDPPLWEHLRVCLELVNRILQALIEDKHHGAYWSDFIDIFGPPPAPNDSVLLSYQTEQIISRKRGVPCEWDHVNTYTSAAWEERLIKLTKRVVWGFRGPDGPEASTHTCVMVDNKLPSSYNAAISIHRPGTLGELCMAQVDTALTMMHEIMHVIGIVRYKDDDYIGNCLTRQRSGAAAQEPFLDGEGIAELGHCMDQAFFGGTKALAPLTKTEIVPPMIFAMKEFPFRSYKGRSAPRSAFLRPDATNTFHHVPLTWVSKMLSEHFWQDPTYPRKSDNYFHRNFLCSSITSNSARVTNDAQPQNLQGLPYSYPDDALVMANWNERHRLWNHFRRGWYDRGKKLWDMSPWNDIVSRLRCEEFALAYQKQDIKECTRLANQLVNRVRWQNQAVYLRDTPSYTNKSPNWAWHAVGLLMMASLPIQTTTLPEASASQGHFKELTVISLNDPKKPATGIEPDKFYDPIRANGQKIDFTQFDFIKKTLRPFPPAASLRDGRRNFFLVDEDGKQYPTDECHIWTLSLAMHHHPSVFSKLEDFILER
ncbi:hypothetical protein F5B22DRAFT_654381 [Xylaria bambusicola]|uniref:uncharacterized protein n=1 Tax=Xylaria bambusicola TaxID=326684 RepID=UPI0020077252|nr:uncharacterized protein F5B22DRAFT_654381 [Xylaria bambusicola]KAI0518054.1 hypothetical protein F5B22DRAFT_654381 [Xylaria bambusicola]